MSRTPIGELTYQDLNSVPRDIDWREAYGEDCEGWQSWETAECPVCEETVVTTPSGCCPDCDADMESAEGPMMNYFYPCSLGRFDAETAALALDGLPLCVVELRDGETGLALTGGGMDLTWEICEAFMRLGLVPPSHFASDLPGMAGRGESEHDRWIISGCRLALEAARDRALRALDRLEDQARQWAER